MKNFTTKLQRIATLIGCAAPLCGLLSSARAGTLIDPISPNWARPTSASMAAATNTLYAEWDGFASPATTASNAPTGPSYFGAALTPVPTAGQTSDQSGAAFSGILNGVLTTSSYYPANTKVGDIYSTGQITPQIKVPTYGITGNALNVLVQATIDGSAIDPSLLQVNGVSASTLPHYVTSVPYTDGGSDSGFGGTAFNNTYAWSFTLPVDPSSLQLNFGWGASSSALVALSIDTQSVPEPASLGLLGLSSLVLLRRRGHR